MVEVSRSGAAKSMISYHKIQRNTARIARTVFIVAVCRTFMRSILIMLYRPLIDRYRPPS
jgi:hypothetical protein